MSISLTSKWLQQITGCVPNLDTASINIDGNLRVRNASMDLDQFYDSNEEEKKVEDVEQIGDTTEIAEAWNRMGIIQFRMQNNIPLAIACFEKAISLYQGQLVSTACTLIDVAECHERLEQPLKALEYYQLSVKLLEEEGGISQFHPALFKGRRAILRLGHFLER